MKYIEGINRSQLILFPEKLDELIPDTNPVRLIDEFVNHLNLKELGFTKTQIVSSSPGTPCYSPFDLLKLYIYGYYKKVRSSRKLMELCETNIEVMWLVCRLQPDFRTISDFRKENAVSVKQVFKTFVSLCAEIGLYNVEVGVQDGSKFRAVNSKDENITSGKLEKRLEFIDEKIEKYLTDLDKNDAEEPDTSKYTKEEIEEKLKILRGRREEYQNYQRELQEAGETQKSFTDPESRLMKTSNGGFDVCYNVQIVVDPESHLVGAVEVTNECNDMGLLSVVTDKIKEDLGIEVMEAVADKGYESHADMLECLLNGVIVHVPSKSGDESYELELEYKEAIITDELLNSTKPEDIKTCLESGIVPNVYKDKGIEATVHEVEQRSSDDSDKSSFTLTEDGTAVICPNGSTLSKVARLHSKDKANRTRFTSRSACKKCKEKCTTSAFKQVDLKDGQTVLYTKKRNIVKMVRITLTPDQVKIRNRKSVVEHPFGTVKRWNDGSYTLLRGKDKVAADLSLLFLAYNIKRAISMVGVQGFIDKMKGSNTFFYQPFYAFASFYLFYKFKSLFSTHYA
jgi:transposase